MITILNKYFFNGKQISVEEAKNLIGDNPVKGKVRIDSDRNIAVCELKGNKITIIVERAI